MGPFLLALVLQEGIPPLKPTERGNKYMSFAWFDFAKNESLGNNFQDRFDAHVFTGLSEGAREIHSGKLCLSVWPSKWWVRADSEAETTTFYQRKFR